MFQFQFQFQFIFSAILHIPHIMQNKIWQGDTKKAVLINMCLPMINNKLLEICKGEPNNLEQQYWTCFVLFFF